MKKIRYFLLILVILLVSFWWLFPQVFRCLTVEQQGFVLIQPTIFVSPKTLQKQQDSLKKFVEIAQKRINNFWKGQHGKAKIIFCDNSTLYAQYCQTAEGAGCSVGTPFGSWIILNDYGLNTDVLAHEMCHDELMTRLGWWKTKRQIPTWFDEGLALQLDYRFGAAKDSLQRYADYRAALEMVSPTFLPLKDLITNRDFFEKTAFYTKVAYLTSATEVSRKIAVKGRKSIWQLVDNLNEGKSFEQIYFKN